MTGVASAYEPHALARARAVPIQTYVRTAGVLFLISMVCGGFGEVYVPSRLVVAGDAAATASNIVNFDSLFRLGFASYLIEALCDLSLALLFYMILKPVRKDLALLAAFFGIASTALYGVAEVFYFAPSLLLGGAEYLKPFSADQLNALTLLSLKMYGRVGGMFMALYGMASLLRGYLIYRSGFLPKTLGVLLGIAGVGFIVRNYTLVLAPRYASDLLLAPTFLAAASLTLWMLVKGVDVAKWEATAAAAE